MAVIRYPGLSYFSNPFEELARMQRQMDRLFGSLMSGTSGATGSGVFPALNIDEDADNFYARAELPGIKPEDIEISVVGNTLTLSGERKADGVENVSYHRRERMPGCFRKAVTLPHEINGEAVRAEFANGVLRLVLPKAEHAKPRKIAVKSE
ncbi:Hsp20/alpha crystallin family protein [Syntrophobacter fumaroxidans]|uniref:Heat shock protein Hsp20 n=1 Tax=Syntrophobacter fumaroxidans (strain DSM 10017 / MPOB) TaxID=335543 RepID=A0LKU5_SYNFM|nr:Hsp20/alpha crystallin family protein [Syntrophobacter fumaroxidans]ABK18047.1 heat shock protein Hsp20 [Syntrophobacter fumaroxidans MPOB]